MIRLFPNGCIVDTDRREGWVAAEEYGTAPAVLARVQYVDPVMSAAMLAEVERVYWVRRLSALLAWARASVDPPDPRP